MKKPLADKKIQRLIIAIVSVMILGMVMVLVIIPGVRDSEFSKLKKYDTIDRTQLGEAMKRKQKISDGRYYTTTGHIESEDARIYKIGDFTTNIRGDSKKKLILNLSVQYSNSDVPDELQSKNPLVRNAMIAICSDARNLQSNMGKKRLKEDIKRELNGLVSEGEVTEVYFNRFIIQ